MTTQSLHPSRLFPSGFARFGYTYLVNMVIPAAFLTLLPTWQLVVTGIVALIAFAVVYVTSYWIGYRGKMWCIVIEVALMVIMTITLSPGYITMFFYPAAQLGLLRKRHMQLGLTVLVTVGLLSLLLPIHLRHQHIAGAYWAMIAAGVLIAMGTTSGTYLQAERNRSQAALRRANDEIERLAKIAERERIAQDLHDVIGHDLAIITLKSQLLDRLIDREPERAHQEARDIEVAARQALTRARDYISAVREPSLLDEWRAAARLIRTAGMVCECDAEDNLPTDGCESAQALAMCLREAVTNAVRHSEARRVTLRCRIEAGSVRLLVEDDGQGIAATPTSTADYASASTPVARGTRPVERAGNGLNGIRARLSAVGGQLDIWSNGDWLSRSISDLPSISHPHGTVVCMRAPWPGTA